MRVENIYVLIVLIYTSLIHLIESCRGISSISGDGCTITLRLPSDQTGGYNLNVSVSIPSTRQQFHQQNVRFENENDVQHGIATHLVFTVPLPICTYEARITALIYNGRVLCHDHPYSEYTTNGASQFHYFSWAILPLAALQRIAVQGVQTISEDLDNDFLREYIASSPPRDDSEMVVACGSSPIPLITNDVTTLSAIHLHPQYDAVIYKHDVAVAMVHNAMRAARPICLWHTTDAHSRTAVNDGMVAGFGPDYRHFRKVRLPMVSRERCLGSDVQFHFALSEFSFCAGLRNNSGPCVGDSGAGFMQWIDGRYHIRGLVSASLRNANHSCDLERYIIFADLATETQWIQSVVIT